MDFDGAMDIVDMSKLREIEQLVVQYCGAAKVFENSLLLNKILEYLVYNNDKKISTKMTQTLRMVNKDWLEATTNLLKRSVKPLIVVTLDENNSLHESEEVKKFGKRLDQLVVTFRNTNRPVRSFLPFKLNLSLGYFREENHNSLADCLTHLGNDLLELQVTFPKDGGSMPFTFPEFTLPSLRKLSFEFSNQDYEKRDNDKTSFGNNRNAIELLQLIVNASVHIEELEIPWNRTTEDLVPTNFESLQLPSTILSLNWFIPMNRERLTILLSYQLPHLKYLAIRLPKLHPLDGDILFRILDHFRKTLRNFWVKPDTVNDRPRGYFRLPIMERLEHLQISSLQCQVDQENLQACLPNLTKVDFTHQTKVLFDNWIRSSKFKSVYSLFVSLRTEELTQGNLFESIDLNMMEQVHSAFPNLTRLALTYSSRDMNSLKYIFKNMQQLKSLQIIIVSEHNLQDTGRYLIDSALLGVPVKLVEALSENADFVELVRLKYNKEESICNLSELVAFSILSKTVPPLAPLAGGNDIRPFISDLMFTQGFFEMPRLGLLRLQGNIKASSKMIDLWRRRGRLIEIAAEPIPLNDL